MTAADSAAAASLSVAPAHLGQVPAVLFLCVHNAGRSQMALGWFNQLAGDRGVAWSGGSEPASEVNPIAVAEIGRAHV